MPIQIQQVRRNDVRLGRIAGSLSGTLQSIGDLQRDLNEVISDVFGGPDGAIDREDPRVTTEARYVHAMLRHQSAALEAARQAVVAVANQIAECQSNQPWPND